MFSWITSKCTFAKGKVHFAGSHITSEAATFLTFLCMRQEQWNCPRSLAQFSRRSRLRGSLHHQWGSDTPFLCTCLRLWDRSHLRRTCDCYSIEYWTLPWNLVEYYATTLDEEFIAQISPLMATFHCVRDSEFPIRYIIQYLKPQDSPLITKG